MHQSKGIEKSNRIYIYQFKTTNAAWAAFPNFILRSWEHLNGFKQLGIRNFGLNPFRSVPNEKNLESSFIY